MPPASKKGTGKAAPRDRRSSSRHSTPVSALTETAPTTPAPPTPSATSQPAAPALPKETPYLRTPTASLIAADLTIDSLIDKSHPSTLKPHDPPTARELHILHERIRDTVLSAFSKRGETCERNLRAVVQKRKERAQVEREREAAEQVAAVEKARKDRESSGKSKKTGQKRSREEADDGEERERKESIPSVGAHGLARQDGVGVHEGAPPPPSPPIEPGVAAPDPMDTAASPSDSEMSHADPPATVPLYERAFGKDPTQFDDPTVYDIREANDRMTYEQKKAIYQVAQWPHSDLHDLTAGTPPDMDFSNAKPANQVNFSTFQTYAEPFIRPFTEEEVAFLKERGDRVTPYIIPQRGARTYKEVWAAEDGLTGTEAPRREQPDPNVPRGGLDDMNDEVAETDEVSMGPVMSRLLSVLRPQPNTASSTTAPLPPENPEPPPMDLSNFDPDAPDPPNPAPFDPHPSTAAPATALPPDALRPTTLPAPDYDAFEHRALQELKYIGFLSPSDTPSYSSHLDDEVATRLRTLQSELRTLSARNNARRARVLELTEERMAMQEYSHIADDLDNQVNAAYLKRNRSLAKPSNKKGGSAAAAARAAAQGRGVAGQRGVSEGVRVLMQKRRDWIDMVGPVVRFGRPEILGDGESVFEEDVMGRFERAEGEAEAGEAEGE